VRRTGYLQNTLSVNLLAFQAIACPTTCQTRNKGKENRIVIQVRAVSDPKAAKKNNLTVVSMKL